MELTLIGYIWEEVRYRFPVMCASHGLRKHHRYIDALKKKYKKFYLFSNHEKKQTKQKTKKRKCSDMNKYNISDQRPTCTLEQSFIWVSWGMVFVTTTASKQALFILEMAGPEKIPCVKIAYTLVAPAAVNFSAAWQMVPHVSAISSTKMATLSFTSPTSTMESTSFAFFLSLWIRANSTFNLSAMEVTLLAPPASGDTIMLFLHSEMFSLIHLRTAGSAYRLSTGMSKKPWIWEAWRSIVMMWSVPATDSIFATNLAEMGARLCLEKKKIGC